MRLAPCPDCKRPISRSATTCPQCGKPIKPEDLSAPADAEQKRNVGGIVVLVLMALLILLLIFASRQPSQRDVDRSVDKWLERQSGRGTNR